MMTIREQARAARARGDRTFTGTPCPLGHVERYADADGTCIECKRYAASAAGRDTVRAIKRGILAGDPVPEGYSATVRRGAVTLRRIGSHGHRP